MFAKFNKIGVASAVAAALGASGAAQAVILGQPGGALLVPHVIADAASQVNTLIGVVVGDNLPPSVNVQPDQNPPAPWFTYGTINQGPPGCVNDSAAASAGNRPSLHWYFFDTESVKKRDGLIAVTCNDFVRMDWNFLTTGTNLQGVAGYMVIGDNRANGGAPSQLALWGASYLIQGFWQSEAFIPVLPLYDVADSDPFDEVSYSAGFPSNVNPVSAGMALPAVGSGSEVAQFSLRYFNDPALSGNTRFVVWLPNNDAGRGAVGVLVYDADEAFVSSTIDLSNELTVINSLTDPNLAGVTTNNPAATSAFGAPHVIPDAAQTSPAVDSGFVIFSIQDGAGASVGEFGAGSRRAGVAFSLVGIGASGSGVQVQTEMAHERGVSGGVPAEPAPAP